MAGNDWINSYLEAILNVGQGLEDKKSSLLLRERGRFSPTRYFVEEVITGFDETDLHRSWVKASAMKTTKERNTRLENMCWRIWNLARRKKQLEGEESQRVAKRRLERERGRRDATADMSEDLSEGEKGDVVAELSPHGESNRGRMARVVSVDAMESWAAQQKEKSLHGLIRGENMELGRDSDTGGQVKYVVELARALATMPGVYRVDLLTRQISSPDVDCTYGEPTEMLNLEKLENHNQEIGESSGAYIIRIPFGPKDKYVAKELLWPHVPEFVDGALSHIIQMSKVLGEQIGGGEPVWPVAIHGHYADAGDSAALLSGVLNVPMVFTGHSLGRDKLEQLLKQGRLTREEINTTYKIMRRIEAEELCLDASEIIITSTRQEIEEQWRLYDGFDPVLERKLRARAKRGVSCYGRFMPRMVVIPPGMEFHHIVVHDGDIDVDAEGNDEHSGTHHPPIWGEIMRFFSNPHKPMILALARADPKKNITTLVKAFGECRPLRDLANLTLIMGNRDDIDEMASTNASVILSILKLIDKYDLYGQVAYPKHHKQSDVPDIYRLAAKTKGVFINPAFIEPFGLTLIEAAAYGLPIVATKNGGPVDIHRVLDNGLLVDPHDQQAIADALLKLVADKQLWARCRQNGLKNIHLFSWPAHCKSYLARIASCKPRQPQWRNTFNGDEGSDSDSAGESLREIQDISLNLKFSLDGEKTDATTVFENALDAEENAPCGNSIQRNEVAKWSNGIFDGCAKLLSLKRKKYMVVVALDCLRSDLMNAIKIILQTLKSSSMSESIGFIMSTSLSISEIHDLLTSGSVSSTEFHAYICNSGSEIYYPSVNSEDHPSGLPFIVDLDYSSHVEYRWGGEGLRKTLVRWVASVNEKNGETVIYEDEATSTSHCFAFQITKAEEMPPVKELRKMIRIQALRCNAIYCQNATRLNVIPVLASRSQALRYFYIRWGMDLTNTVVFIGETGDTDYEGLLGGVHKSVILKGVCSTEPKLYTNRSYPLEDVLPLDSPNIVHAEELSSDAMKTALEKLKVLIN